MPTASSALERTFSHISGHFSSERNRINAKTLESIIQTAEHSNFMGQFNGIANNLNK